MAIFYHLYSHKIFFWLFVFTFILQVGFWYKTEKIKPSFEIVPPAPSRYLVEAASFGDKEFLFRTLGLRLQNSGDVFAGFVALKNYDYSRIYQWLKTLDSLNEKSNFAPSLASYYYAQTQNKSDTRYVVDYLEERADRDIDQNWWWAFQAIYIAKNNLYDMPRALKLAEKLSQNNAKNAPLWTKEMPAFIYAEMGNNCMAFAVIEKLLQESQNGARQISVEEMNFMRYFINERLNKLKAQKFDPRKCHKI
jgi:hypothetical protein